MIRGLFVLGILFIVLSISLNTASAQQTSEGKPFVSANNAFALDLYAKVKDTPGNVFFSPYSISSALAMTYAGAKGNTEKQMAGALHFGHDPATVHAAFKDIQSSINETQKKGEVRLETANSLWLQKEYPFLPAFRGVISKNYDAVFFSVDFKTGAEKARTDINDWVAKKTKEKILNLIPQGMLDASTRLVLVNAIYFKGSWAVPFDSARTQSMRFFPTVTDSLMTRMMCMADHTFDYTENDAVQCIELPYNGRDVSMIVILPKKKDGLAAFEKTISTREVDTLLSSMRGTSLTVLLPKFKITQEYVLNDALSRLGMVDAFGGEADFSGMTGKKDLNISAIIHKAFVEVDERGTEAAAATAVVMRAMAVRQPPKSVVFCADHPFLVLIRDNTTGSILFMGRIADPSR